jgi:hypothetical protein
MAIGWPNAERYVPAEKKSEQLNTSDRCTDMVNDGHAHGQHLGEQLYYLVSFAKHGHMRDAVS